MTTYSPADGWDVSSVLTDVCSFDLSAGTGAAGNRNQPWCPNSGVSLPHVQFRRSPE
jgi:hypothetical protein